MISSQTAYTTATQNPKKGMTEKIIGIPSLSKLSSIHTTKHNIGVRDRSLIMTWGQQTRGQQTTIACNDL